MILEEMMGRLPLNRLHDAARREVRRGAEQQMDMIGAHVPLQHLNVLRSTDLPNQISDLSANITAEHRLAYFVMNTKW